MDTSVLASRDRSQERVKGICDINDDDDDYNSTISVKQLEYSERKQL